MRSKNLYPKLLFLNVAVILILAFPAQAQNNTKGGDRLFLENGFILYGQLVEYKPSGDIVFDLNNGTRRTFPSQWVKKLKMAEPKLESEGQEQIKCKIYQFPNHTWYHHLHFGVISPEKKRNNNILNIGTTINYTLGYRFNPQINVGFSTGLETYDASSKAYFIPIALEYSCYFLDQYTTPYFSVRSGYGISANFDEDEFGTTLIKNKGGLYLFPSIGWRINGRDKLNYTLEMGFKIQKAKYTYRNSWGGEESWEQDITHRRFTFRFGLLF